MLSDKSNKKEMNVPAELTDSKSQAQMVPVLGNLLSVKVITISFPIEIPILTASFLTKFFKNNDEAVELCKNWFGFRLSVSNRTDVQIVLTAICTEASQICF